MIHENNSLSGCDCMLADCGIGHDAAKEVIGGAKTIAHSCVCDKPLNGLGTQNDRYR
jgi:hypothetical protein